MRPSSLRRRGVERRGRDTVRGLLVGGTLVRGCWNLAGRRERDQAPAQTLERIVPDQLSGERIKAEKLSARRGEEAMALQGDVGEVLPLERRSPHLGAGCRVERQHGSADSDEDQIVGRQRRTHLAPLYERGHCRGEMRRRRLESGARIARGKWAKIRGKR